MMTESNLAESIEVPTSNQQVVNTEQPQQDTVSYVIPYEIVETAESNIMQQSSTSAAPDTKTEEVKQQPILNEEQVVPPPTNATISTSMEKTKKLKAKIEVCSNHGFWQGSMVIFAAILSFFCIIVLCLMFSAYITLIVGMYKEYYLFTKHFSCNENSCHWILQWWTMGTQGAKLCCSYHVTHQFGPQCAHYSEAINISPSMHYDDGTLLLIVYDAIEFYHDQHGHCRCLYRMLLLWQHG